MLGLIFTALFFTIAISMAIGELIAYNFPNTKFANWWRYYVIAHHD